MASNNTLVLQGSLTRSRVQGGQHTLPILQTLTNLTDLVVREKTIVHGAGLIALPFDNVTAKSLVIYTPQALAFRLNGSGIDNGTVGSFLILLDTNITSCSLRNDDAAKDAVIEFWIGS